MTLSSCLKPLVAIVVTTQALRADIAADFASITGSAAGQNVSGWGSPGSVARHGRAAFPVLMDTNGVAMMAAGRYNDSYASTAARAVAFSHNGPLGGGGDSMPTLLENSVKWASRKTTPSTITVGCGAGISTTFWTSRGYLVKSVTTTMSSSTNDLSGVDVFIFDWHSGYNASAVSKIQTFTAAGGGIVCGATPWALGATPTADAYAVMGFFGLTYSGDGWGGASPFPVPTTAPSALYNALAALDALLLDQAGTTTMTLSQKVTACRTVDQSVAARPDQAAVNAALETLSDAFGWVQVTPSAPLVKADKPKEAMLARYQSGKFSTTPVSTSNPDWIAHPSAAGWPGLPASGSTVTKTVSVDGNVPADYYMNQGSRGRRVNTGLYAAPGAVVTVTIPSDKVAGGLEVETGIHIDENFHLDQWNRFPKVVRRDKLTTVSTNTGCVFGGLVHLYVPAGATLGTFNVTISGALEAPCFVRGTDNDTNWVSTLRDKPGAWGYIQTSKSVVYVSRNHLSQLASAQKVADYWYNAVTIADQRLGYTNFRKREEAFLSDIDISAGGGHAGFPVMMAYGDSDNLINYAVNTGDWGFYHELGHTFQDDFDGAFGIATHGEVDVNLVPGALCTELLPRSPWDNRSHSTFDAADRISDRAAFFAMSASSQTWSAACGGRPMAYDFYFNLADAFGWQAYGTAFQRLMTWLQGGSDAALSALSSGDANYMRNRFYVLLCDATQRNLDSYFQKYGLGVTGRGYEITQSVKDSITAKGYAVWNDNQAITAISNPGTLGVAEDTPSDTVLHTFTVTDADPGELHWFYLTAGDPNGDFQLDPLTGQLRVRTLDYERQTSYSLTVTAYGNGIPFSGTRHSITRSFTVNVANAPDVPVVSGKLFTATSAMGAGTVLGTATATVDPGRTLTGWSIVAGDGGGLFAINASGQITVQVPGSLGSPAAYLLTVKATDSAGQAGYGKVAVYANGSLGVREERWTGYGVTTGTPVYTGYLTSFTSAENVADNYTRRLTGWLVPPTTGMYTFWIASDDDSQLSLSSSADPVAKASIAGVGGWTGYQSWDEKASQKSTAVFLVAGQPYYLEAIQSEGGGGDHVAVAWQGPGITRAVIPGSALVPAAPGVSFGATPVPAPVVTLTSPVAGAAYSAPASVSFAATVTDNNNSIAKVQFLDGGTVVAEDYTSPYTGSFSTSTTGSHPISARVVYGIPGSTVSSSAASVTVTGSLPAGWSGSNIGSVGVSGGSGYSGGAFTVTGSGADIWNSSDAFYYAYTSLTGDGEIRARVTSQTNTWPWAKAGVMIRDGTAAGAAHAMMVVTPGNGFAFQYRTTSGGGSSHTAGPALNAFPNNWVRLTRSGSTITSYVSANGTSWTQVGTATIAMASTVNIGLPVTSTNNSTASVATFDNVTVTPYPSPWISADIGSPGLAGKAEFFGNVHTLTGAGTLGGTTDGYRYVYQSLSGDGSVIARVSTLQNTSGARVGVMIRDTLANNSRMAALGVDGAGAWQWQRRTTAGGSVTTTASSSGTAPNLWVRIVRSGNTFTASRSTNGTSWTTIGSGVTITMATNCYIGLSVASGSTTATNTSSFDNITVVP